MAKSHEHKQPIKSVLKRRYSYNRFGAKPDPNLAPRLTRHPVRYGLLMLMSNSRLPFAEPPHPSIALNDQVEAGPLQLDTISLDTRAKALVMRPPDTLIVCGLVGLRAIAITSTDGIVVRYGVFRAGASLMSARSSRDDPRLRASPPDNQRERVILPRAKCGGSALSQRRAGSKRVWTVACDAVSTSWVIEAEKVIFPRKNGQS